MWKVEISIDENDNNEFNELVLRDNDELLPAKRIKTYFTNNPLDDHIHIIVSSPNPFSNKKRLEKHNKGKFEYFELFSHEKWSILHFITWVKETYNYSKENNIWCQFFYDILHAISIDDCALQDVRDVTFKLLRRKKVSL